MPLAARGSQGTVGSKLSVSEQDGEGNNKPGTRSQVLDTTYKRESSRYQNVNVDLSPGIRAPGDTKNRRPAALHHRT